MERHADVLVREAHEAHDVRPLDGRRENRQVRGVAGRQREDTPVAQRRPVVVPQRAGDRSRYRYVDFTTDSVFKTVDRANSFS